MCVGCVIVINDNIFQCFAINIFSNRWFMLFAWLWYIMIGQISILPLWGSHHHTGQDRSKWFVFWHILKRNHPNQEYSPVLLLCHPTAVYPSIPFSEKSTSDLVREGPELGLDVSWHMGGRRNVLDYTLKYHLTTARLNTILVNTILSNAITTAHTWIHYYINREACSTSQTQILSHHL